MYENMLRICCMPGTELGIGIAHKVTALRSSESRGEVNMHMATSWNNKKVRVHSSFVPMPWVGVSQAHHSDLGDLTQPGSAYFSALSAHHKPFTFQ